MIFGLMLLSLAVHAEDFPTSGQSWASIRANPNVIVTNDFQAYGPHGVFNVCADGDTLRSVEPVRVCAEFVTTPDRGQGGAESASQVNCGRADYREVSMPKTRIADLCAEYAGGSGEETLQCARYERRPVTIATEQTLGVWYVENNRSEFLFNKNYTIPTCER